MEFLQLSAETHKKYIVKLNVLRKNRGEVSDFERFVFVFSQCIEDNSSYGNVDIELVPEKEIPIFHESLGDYSHREVKDEEFVDDHGVQIDDGNASKITIMKNISDFTTNYIAKIEEDLNSDQPPKYHLLLTRNRGKIGKLERVPNTSFAVDFQITVCDYKAKLEKTHIETSFEKIQQLPGESREELITQLEREKLQVEMRSAADCLRSFYQGNC